MLNYGPLMALKLRKYCTAGGAAYFKFAVLATAGFVRLSMMIFFVAQNSASPVNLFGKNKPHQLMRER